MYNVSHCSNVPGLERIFEYWKKNEASAVRHGPTVGCQKAVQICLQNIDQWEASIREARDIISRSQRAFEENGHSWLLWKKPPYFSGKVSNINKSKKQLRSNIEAAAISPRPHSKRSSISTPRNPSDNSTVAYEGPESYGSHSTVTRFDATPDRTKTVSG